MARRDVPLPEHYEPKGRGWVLLDGIPFPVIVVKTENLYLFIHSPTGYWAQRLNPGFDAIWLTEDVGTEEDPENYYPASGLRYGKFAGYHETTGYPLYEPVTGVPSYDPVTNKWTDPSGAFEFLRPKDVPREFVRGLEEFFGLDK
jgi:hypothetical protein